MLTFQMVVLRAVCVRGAAKYFGFVLCLNWSFPAASNSPGVGQSLLQSFNEIDPGTSGVV